MDDNGIINAAAEFDSLFFSKAPFSEFSNLFEKYAIYCPEIFKHMLFRDKMLDVDFLINCDKAHLYAIDRGMEHESSVWKARIAARTMLEKNVPGQIKAFMWSMMKNCSFFDSWTDARRDLAIGVLADNYGVIREMKYFKKGTPEELNFIKEISSMNFRRYYANVYDPGNEQIREAIRRDSVSMFEISRQINGSNIGVLLMDCLVQESAANIFFYLLKKYPGKILKMRSMSNWIVAILSNVHREKDVIRFIDGFEDFEPGIIARVRDPWGNNLLHYRLGRKDSSVNRLIELGCDPDCVNQFGLSYNLVKETDFGYKNAFIEKYGFPYNRNN